jgi:tetratricopeptide (TPR) repeat protein
VVCGIFLLFSCKNQHKTEEAANPVFQSDPNLKKITDLIEKSPGNADFYFQRGRMLRKLQYDSLALKDFKKASSLDTNRADYYSAVGDLLFEKKDLNGSVEWIQKAIAKNPEDRKAHLKIAKVFLYIKQYQKAFGEINIVLRHNVYDPEAYFLKGMLYKDMKDTAKAISNFLTSVQVSPDYKDAIIQLGLLYSAKKDPVALKYFDNAFAVDTLDVFPIYAKGVYYQDNKDFAKAKEQYRECIIRNRHYADAYFNMGWILMQEDSIQKAWRQYDIVTKIDPTNPTAYYNRGVCSELMDSVKKAISDYRLAASLDTSYKSPREALKKLGVKETN